MTALKTIGIKYQPMISRVSIMKIILAIEAQNEPKQA